MIRNLVVLLPFALVLSACTETNPACKSPAAVELQTVDRLIAETKGNIARGYSVQQTWSGMNFCLGGGGNNVGLSFCNDVGGKTTAVPIDKAAEQRSLKALEARRAELVKQAGADAQLCAAGA
jgi:hypothetical protein